MTTQAEVVCVILGGGGHAQVLIDSIHLSGMRWPQAILDADQSRWGQMILGVPILGGDELLPELVRRGFTCFAVGLGGIGDNRPRQRLFELGLFYHLEPLTIIHPAAIRSQWAEIGPGSQIFPGSIINAGARLGQNVIINSGAIVEHDCSLSDHVHVATGARLASTVQVGRGAHIGAGATVKQCLIIGEGAIVGAGATVIKDVPAHTVVVGVPARPLRQAGSECEWLIPKEEDP